MEGRKGCPGQNTLFWKKDDIYEIHCVHCRYSVEFFKNDVKRTCPNCKQVVLNPRMDFACADWCTKVEDCLGPVMYGEFMERKELEDRRQEHFQALLQAVPAEDREAADLLAELYESSDGSSLLDLERLREIRDSNPELAARVSAFYRSFVQARTD